GASKVSAYATHGVLSGPAAERLAASRLHELVITDTIAQPKAIMDTGKVRVITAAPLLGEAISRIYSAKSVSSLYD
ncbi:MAG: phosphoribosylpyrophosphate synthetase, partial [Mariprofundaceae bacterium]|nr:phosphoribosylpyrophosphate synthetase [Mariprofundaceae bacterium]